MSHNLIQDVNTLEWEDNEFKFGNSEFEVTTQNTNGNETRQRIVGIFSSIQESYLISGILWLPLLRHIFYDQLHKNVMA